MRTASTQLIEAWFAQHDDGEFARHERSAPYSLIAPSSRAGCILYTTKPATVASVLEGHEDSCPDVGLIGGYGLPNALDVRWIRDVTGRRGLLFLGDMDPSDLLIFCWLREQLAPERITHLGLNHAFLDALQLSFAAFAIPCGSSEQEALPVLDIVFAEFREVVGAACAHMLVQGHKIELEAMLSAKQAAARVLQASVLLDG